MRSQSTIGIHGRAMLARLSISTWTARKYDKRVSAEVNAQHSASHDAGRFNKHLFGGKAASASHAATIAAAGAARTAHYTNTLPWSDEGWRVLPTANYFAYIETMRNARNAFESAVRDFLSEYPALQSAARHLLNGLYRDEDYPDQEDAARRFAFSVDYGPIPDVGDVRVDLPSGQIAAIEQGIQSRVEQATNAAMRDAWERMVGVVSKLRDKLADPGAIFRDSLVSNVGEVTDILARLNITEDPDLEAMRQRVSRELASLEPDTLRKEKGTREQAAARAQSILDRMADLMGGPQS